MENLCQENDCNHSSPPITNADENIAVKTRSVAAGVLAVGTLKWSIRVEASADRDEGLAQVSSPRKHRRWKKKTKKKQTNERCSIDQSDHSCETTHRRLDISSLDDPTVE